MKKSNVLIGIEGEDCAKRFLLDAGFKILATNWKSKLGEIDIIARESTTIVFVEVKNRSNFGFGFGEEAVNKLKQQKIIRAAISYIKQNLLEDHDFRFDVIVVQNRKINYYKDAYSAEHYYM
ncbi:MAG: YraN family protein [bacterium]